MFGKAAKSLTSEMTKMIEPKNAENLKNSMLIFGSPKQGSWGWHAADKKLWPF